MIEMLRAPWPWYVVGPLIAVVMYLMIYSGKAFGISSTFRTMCSIGGGGKYADFFRFNWRGQVWNLVFVAGTFLGGVVSVLWLQSEEPMQLNEKVVQELEVMGINSPGKELAPGEIFAWDQLMSLEGILFMVLGGFLVGFGARYAGGCTSGHAISGLSNLQLPSLIAVIGFFIGGLVSTYFLIPYFLDL
ncbi:YeeE/YedE family protein [Fulvivirga sediminis]|uniref:YeeE/YedE family protein n=1 Tax=Fulvivirga sediminis TaxID=2803949 RepID=A0A937FCS7_9BACT|nr:YeeE/YedE thiosulfate transporter family protein [Fulvivirga sediminis]MBL3658530.1 YeeE/YedE family protein [Fulvivirga sediminis]